MITVVGGILQILCHSVVVSAPEAGGRTVVMTTTQPQPVVTSSIATTTIIGFTPANVGPATVQLTAASTLSLQGPVAMGHRSGVGIIHAPPLTAQVCQVSVETTNATFEGSTQGSRSELSS